MLVSHVAIGRPTEHAAYFYHPFVIAEYSSLRGCDTSDDRFVDDDVRVCVRGHLGEVGDYKDLALSLIHI